MIKLYDKINKGVYIIAEMSANHGGSLEQALEIVHAAKESGADCIKLQTYTADTLTLKCDNEHFKLKGGLWDGYYLYDLYNEAHMPWEWQKRIKEEADKLGIDFLSTPFDETAVDFLEELGVEFYKIASFELIHTPLVRYIARKNKPIIMSCGMANLEEIEEAVNAIYEEGNRDVILLKCCSEYPADYESMNLAQIQLLQEKFKVTVGLSDHSMGSIAPLIAVGLGAKVIEKHFCLSRKIEGPDSAFSMEPEEFKKMVQDVEVAIKTIGEKQYTLTEREQRSRKNRRSIYASKEIKEGELITRDNIKVVRPAAGLQPKYYEEILNMRATRDISFGTPIQWEQLEKRDC